jgi:mannose-6-phosphate isomerase-like protein (cupin superfamily)
MTKRKHEKLFVKEYTIKPTPEGIKKQEEQKRSGNYVLADDLFSLGNEVIKGSFYTTCVLLKEKKGTEPVESTPAHSHDFDEILIFTGTDTNNPRDLGGEIEFWLEDEPYIITESCLLFVPKGMKHSPMIVRKIERPIYFITAAPETVYKKIM